MWEIFTLEQLPFCLLGLSTDKCGVFLAIPISPSFSKIKDHYKASIRIFIHSSPGWKQIWNGLTELLALSSCDLQLIFFNLKFHKTVDNLASQFNLSWRLLMWSRFYVYPLEAQSPSGIRC